MLTRRQSLAVLTAAFVGGIEPALGQTPQQPSLPPTLDALTALQIKTPQGDLTRLGDHLTPGPTVIAFWATWCSPCLAEGRELARIRASMPVERLNIIGVNMDRAEVRESDRLARFMQRARMNYTQLWGAVSFYRAFNNPGEGAQIFLPRLYVFAADGRPTAAFGRYDGGASLRAIDRAVDAVLG